MRLLYHGYIPQKNDGTVNKLMSSVSLFKEIFNDIVLFASCDDQEAVRRVDKDIVDLRGMHTFHMKIYVVKDIDGIIGIYGETAGLVGISPVLEAVKSDDLELVVFEVARDTGITR